MKFFASAQYGWNEDTLQNADLTYGNYAKWAVGDFDGLASVAGVTVPWELGVLSFSGMYAEGNGSSWTRLGRSSGEKTRHGLKSYGGAIMNLYFLNKRTFLYSGFAYKEKKDNEIKS